MGKTQFALDMDSFGFTVEQAAEALELSPSTVAAYRQGARNPPTYYMDNFENAKYPKRKVLIARINAKIAAAEKLMPKYEDVNNTENTTLYIAKFAELEMLKSLLAK